MDCKTSVANARRALGICCACIVLAGCSGLPLTEAGFWGTAAADSSESAHAFPAIDIGRVAPPGIQPTVAIETQPLIWPELRANMALPHHLNHQAVKAEIRWLKRNRSYFNRLAPRFARYQTFITRAVRERGMPAEIALLPLVESALNPYAMSPDGAHGLWQFMPATAGRFGLQRDWWQDARRDPVASTEAALDYLEMLHKRFDDWLLAIAAYNTGEGNLRKALKRAQKRYGHPVRDFFSLRLPRETRSYVPRLLALSAAVAEPEAYGLKLPDVTAKIPFHTVYVDSQYDLNVAAEVLGLDPSEVRAWNPALKQWATPPLNRHQTHPLRLPVQNKPAAQTALDAVPQNKRLKWHEVTVRRGDTLSGIARRFGTSVAAIKSTNGLRSNMIRVNSALRVPAGKQSLLAAGQPQHHSYRVRQGDNLWNISRRFGVNHKRLMKLNGIGPRELLRIGQRILVPYDDSTGAVGVQAGG